MAILVTGGSGFLGSVLIPKLEAKGHKVYNLSRKPVGHCGIAIAGNITNPNLEIPRDVHAVYHLAAVHRLAANDPYDILWNTNVIGTYNIIRLCAQHEIPHLYFCSTAYTLGRNPYERSKMLGETLVRKSDIPKVTIFKPSVIMDSEDHFFPGHFSQFVSLAIKIHQRVESVRRGVENAFHLHPMDFNLRIAGNPMGYLNIIPVNVVASAMADIESAGTFWLTHPRPPVLQDLLDWASEFVKFRIQFAEKLRTPLDNIFSKLATAFTPYLYGDSFPSDISYCRPITREYIISVLRQSIV